MHTRKIPGHLSGGAPAYLHTAGPRDTSEGVNTYGQHRNRNYDSKCGWCYLGAPHSVDAHDQAIYEYEE